MTPSEFSNQIVPFIQRAIVVAKTATEGFSEIIDSLELGTEEDTLSARLSLIPTIKRALETEISRLEAALLKELFEKAFPREKE